jgi:hypothetical protein
MFIFREYFMQISAQSLEYLGLKIAFTSVYNLIREMRVCLLFRQQITVFTE